jgi:hypothetical protein
MVSICTRKAAQIGLFSVLDSQKILQNQSRESLRPPQHETTQWHHPDKLLPFRPEL